MSEWKAWSGNMNYFYWNNMLQLSEEKQSLAIVEAKSHSLWNVISDSTLLNSLNLRIGIVVSFNIFILFWL